jgi:hypothetical protein
MYSDGPTTLGSIMNRNKVTHLLLLTSLSAAILFAGTSCGEEPKKPRRVVQFKNAPAQGATPGQPAPNAPPAPTDNRPPADVESSFAPAVDIYASQLEQIIKLQNRQSARVIQINGQPVPKLDKAEPGKQRTGSMHFTASLTQPNEKEASLLYDVTVYFVFRQDRWDYDRQIIDTRFLKQNDLDALTARKFTEQMQALLSSNLLMAGVALEKQLELQRSLQ